MFNGFLMEVLITTYYYLDIFRLSTCSLPSSLPQPPIPLPCNDPLMAPWFLGGDVADVAHLKRKKGSTQFYVGVDREWFFPRGSGNIGSLAPVSTGFLTFSDFSHGVLIQDSPCECVAIVGDLELIPRAQLLGLVGVPEG